MSVQRSVAVKMRVSFHVWFEHVVALQIRIWTAEMALVWPGRILHDHLKLYAQWQNIYPASCDMAPSSSYWCKQTLFPKCNRLWPPKLASVDDMARHHGNMTASRSNRLSKAPSTSFAARRLPPK